MDPLSFAVMSTQDPPRRPDQRSTRHRPTATRRSPSRAPAAARRLLGQALAHLRLRRRTRPTPATLTHPCP